MHGYERCRKNFGVDHHELHVRLYAIKRKNKGRILESRKQAMTAQASKRMMYDRMKYETASTHLVSFWSFREACAVLMVLTQRIKTKCWFDHIDEWLGTCTQDLPFNRRELGAKV